MRVEHRVSKTGQDECTLTSSYEIGWTKKPPLLPLQKRIQKKFETETKKELKEQVPHPKVTLSHATTHSAQYRDLKTLFIRK